jgi:hypothetical protein
MVEPGTARLHPFAGPRTRLRPGHDSVLTQLPATPCQTSKHFGDGPLGGHAVPVKLGQDQPAEQRGQADRDQETEGERRQPARPYPGQLLIPGREDDPRQQDRHAHPPQADPAGGQLPEPLDLLACLTDQPVQPPASA